VMLLPASQLTDPPSSPRRREGRHRRVGTALFAMWPPGSVPTAC
jgi:hypothetical protein